MARRGDRRFAGGRQEGIGDALVRRCAEAVSRPTGDAADLVRIALYEGQQEAVGFVNWELGVDALGKLFHGLTGR
jgi:hypothetical protein